MHVRDGLARTIEYFTSKFGTPLMAPRTPRPRPVQPPPGDRAPSASAGRPARWAGTVERCIFPGLVPNRSVSRGYLLHYAEFSLGRCSPCCCCRSRPAIPISSSASSPPTRRSIAPALAEYQRGKWDNAITAFEKLTARPAGARHAAAARRTGTSRSAHQQSARMAARAARASRASSRAFPTTRSPTTRRSRPPGRTRSCGDKPALDPTYGESARGGVHDAARPVSRPLR